MYPWVRLIHTGFSLIGKARLDTLATTRVRLRVWPNDLDFNLHVNNGRYLTLADISRMHWFVRTGVWEKARRQRAIPIVGDALAKFAATFARSKPSTLKLACWAGITGGDFYSIGSFVKAECSASWRCAVSSKVRTAHWNRVACWPLRLQTVSLPSSRDGSANGMPDANHYRRPYVAKNTSEVGADLSDHHLAREGFDPKGEYLCTP